MYHPTAEQMTNKQDAFVEAMEEAMVKEAFAFLAPVAAQIARTVGVNAVRSGIKAGVHSGATSTAKSATQAAAKSAGRALARPKTLAAKAAGSVAKDKVVSGVVNTAHKVENAVTQPTQPVNTSSHYVAPK